MNQSDPADRPIEALGNRNSDKDREGWLRTGDLVRREADGYLFAVDRLKEVIINAGYNVYPAEVERVIAQLEAVSMVAVAAAKAPLRGQVPASACSALGKRLN